MIGIVINDISITEEEIEAAYQNSVKYYEEEPDCDVKPSREHTILYLVSDIIERQSNAREDISAITVLRD